MLPSHQLMNWTTSSFISDWVYLLRRITVFRDRIQRFFGARHRQPAPDGLVDAKGLA